MFEMEIVRSRTLPRVTPLSAEPPRPPYQQDEQPGDIEHPEDQLVVAGQELRQVDVEVVTPILGVARRDVGEGAAQSLTPFSVLR